jgi:hypothetical protein
MARFEKAIDDHDRIIPSRLPFEKRFQERVVVQFKKLSSAGSTDVRPPEAKLHSGFGAVFALRAHCGRGRPRSEATGGPNLRAEGFLRGGGVGRTLLMKLNVD